MHKRQVSVVKIFECRRDFEREENDNGTASEVLGACKMLTRRDCLSANAFETKSAISFAHRQCDAVGHGLGRRLSAFRSLSCRPRNGGGERHVRLSCGCLCLSARWASVSKSAPS